MAYVLNALIARPEALELVRGVLVVPIAQGFALAPLSDGFWREQGHRSHPLRREAEIRDAPESEFEQPGDRARESEHARSAFAQIAKICAEISKVAPIAYVEAEFFGGSGGQAAAAWTAQQIVWGPLVEEHAINEALQRIGVHRATGDEFDTLGLSRFRFTDQWTTAPSSSR
jgi:hypothetical protein